MRIFRGCHPGFVLNSTHAFLSGKLCIIFATIFLSSCFAGEHKRSVEDLQIIKSDGEVLTYQIELADTADLRAKGLMHRRRMPAEHGMLLAYPEARKVAIWMKNTYIPLDIIYINEGGEITQINTDAVPHDLTSLPSHSDTLGVLELNAGEIRKWNIKVGDKVRHPFFDK